MHNCHRRLARGIWEGDFSSKLRKPHSQSARASQSATPCVVFIRGWFVLRGGVNGRLSSVRAIVQATQKLSEDSNAELKRLLIGVTFLPDDEIIDPIKISCESLSSDEILDFYDETPPADEPIDPVPELLTASSLQELVAANVHLFY